LAFNRGFFQPIKRTIIKKLSKWKKEKRMAGKSLDRKLAPIEVMTQTG